MPADLNGTFPQVARIFADASGALGPDLWKLVREGPKAELDAARVTQPGMLTAGFGVWRPWRRQTGARPALMAGHSPGEYTARVCADAPDFPVSPVFDPDSLNKALKEAEGVE